MYLAEFGSFQIFRPHYIAEETIHNEVDSYLRAKFPPGTYSTSTEINEIFLYLFDFYSKKLGKILPSVASHNFLEFLLYQYDITVSIDQFYKANGNRHDSTWAEIGPIYRRALKYLAERIILLAPPIEPSVTNDQMIFTAEIALICSEQMVKLSILSDSTFSIFPNDTILEILPLGQDQLFIHYIKKEEYQDIQVRARRDRVNRRKYISELDIFYNTDERNKIIGDNFKKSLGITYSQIIQIIQGIIDGAQPNETSFPIPSIKKDETILTVGKYFNIPTNMVEMTISGFSITADAMVSEGREIWKPKQEYRAYRRAFFEFIYPSGRHLVFSKGMARESLIMLIKDMIFNQLPPEWKNADTIQGCSQLSNMAGDWFERTTEDNLNKLGFLTIRNAKHKIGTGEYRVDIPANIGEIDILAYDPREKSFYIIECKLVRDSTEPKLFRDDISDFVISRKSHINKFRRKFAWIESNFTKIQRAFMTTKNIDAQSESISGIIITFLPTIASSFIDDFPCVSLTEFMMDYEERNGWSYAIGRHPLL